MPEFRPSALVFTTLTSALLLATAQCLSAADDATIAQPAALTLTAPNEGWANSGRAGVFFSNVATSSSSTESRDSAIANANGSEAWLLAWDDALLWRGTNKSSDQNLRLRYGRIRVEGDAWTDNNDEIHYDGVFRRDLVKPSFIYGAWGLDTVFRSSVNNKPLDPITAQISAGFGQLYHALLLHGDPARKDAGADRLEWRLGVRAQKRWSSEDVPQQDRIEVGPEAFIRYDRPVDDKLRWYLQYQLFTEFTDIEHVSQLFTAGLTAAVARYVSADISFRAYREQLPKDLPEGTPGYDQWAEREDALIGLTYTY